MHFISQLLFGLENAFPYTWLKAVSSVVGAATDWWELFTTGGFLHVSNGGMRLFLSARPQFFQRSAWSGGLG